MDFLQIIMICLQIMHAISKTKSKHYDSSSSEDSIENLLYYKDCQRKPKETPPASAVPLIRPIIAPSPTPPPKNDCPFPKMCCALSCGNECGGGAPKTSPFLNTQIEPMHTIARDSIGGIQPLMQPIQSSPMLSVQPQLRKRKKIKFPPPGNIPTPINSRRDFGFTKDKIKSLIKQDDDIKTILKDLVRVTMQKVYLGNEAEINADEAMANTQLSSTTTTVVYEDYDEFID